MTNLTVIEPTDVTEIARNPSATPTPSYQDLLNQLLTVHDTIVSSRKPADPLTLSAVSTTTATDPPPPCTDDSLPVRAHARNGKIARLPHTVREEVNQMLRNGVRYDSILQHLTELGHAAISKNSISNWRRGGFVDWLNEQQQREKNLALPWALERCERSDK